MGTWGSRIYEDDSALDLRSDFLEKYHSGAAISEIEASLKQEYFEHDVPEVTDVAILALACVELEVGQLSNDMKQSALEVIASGRQYEHWKRETSPEEAGLRKRELTLIKGYLDNYDGKPVKRKSWIMLQKVDAEQLDADDEGKKLDDVSWHMQDDDTGVSEDEYFARHAFGVASVLHWAVKRAYLSDRLLKESNTRRYQEGTLTIFKYIERQFDGKLYTTDIRAGLARDFISSYYAGSFYKDFSEHIQKDRGDYSFVVAPDELTKMSEVIDARFEEYKTDPKAFIDANTPPVKKRLLLKIFVGAIILLIVVRVVRSFL